MPLIIENGSGVAGADSYVTVAECEAYAIAYYGASLAGSPASKEAALRRAYAYMMGLPWKDSAGYPVFGGAIPQAVKNAQHEFARAEFQSVGILSPQGTLRDSVVNMEKVDVIQVGYDTARLQPGIEALQTVVSAGIRWIAPYLINGGRLGVRLTHAVAV
jgi:hypothetical protein